MERVAIYKAMESIRRSMGRPVRKEFVRTAEMPDGFQVLILGYSTAYQEGTTKWREYRVDIFTPDRKHGGFIVTPERTDNGMG